MGFLIRCAFWLSLVLLIIPIGAGDNDQDQPTVGPVQAFVAAREAVQDVAGMCERKPEVCTTGRAALHTIGIRARESARIASELIDGDEQPVSDISVAQGPDTTLTTGTVLPSPRPEIN